MGKEPNLDYTPTVPKVIKKRHILRSWKDYFYENIRDFFPNTEESEIEETEETDKETAEKKKINE